LDAISSSGVDITPGVAVNAIRESGRNIGEGLARREGTVKIDRVAVTNVQVSDELREK